MSVTAVASVPAKKKAPMLTRSLLLFMLAMILANLGGNMYGPLMPLYLKDLGANIANIGLFFTLSQIIPLVLQILGGWISDTLGRLRAIAIGSVVGMFTYVALIAAPSWHWLLFASAFGAITGSLVGPSFDAYIAENSSEQNRAKMFSITQTLFGVVGVLGPLAGGWLAGALGFRWMLAIAAVLYLLATVLRVGMARWAARKQESKPQPLSFSGLKTNLATMFGMVVSGGVITWILLTDGVRDTSFALSMNLFPVYMQDVGGLTIGQIGLMNSLFGLAMMACFIPGGLLADRKGERFGIAAGMGLVGTSLFMLVNLPAGNAWLYSAGWLLAGGGVGLMQPAYQSLISKAVPRHLRGTAFGLFSTSLGVVSLPAPAIGALLWQSISPQFPFVITAGVCLLAIIPILLKFKLPPGSGQPESTTEAQPQA